MVSGEPDKLALVTTNSCVPARSPRTQEPSPTVPLALVEIVLVEERLAVSLKIKALLIPLLDQLAPASRVSIAFEKLIKSLCGA